MKKAISFKIYKIGSVHAVGT